MVVLVAWLSVRTGEVIDACPFHRITGEPCPTCGTTRAVLAIVLEGDYLGALAYNPGMTILLTVACVLLGIRLATGYTLRLRVGRRGRVVIWGLALVVLAGNWIYVLMTLE